MQRFLNRYEYLFFTMLGAALMLIALAAPAGSWIERSPFGACFAVLVVVNTIYTVLWNIYERRSAESVVRKYRRLAEGGDSIAMFRLATIYKAGRKGLPKDNLQAIHWFRRAADSGNPMAMVSLFLLYHFGEVGLPQDDFRP